MALSLRRRSCPWCCEPLPGGAPSCCPACARPLVLDGAAVRPVDVRHDDVAGEQRQRFLRFLQVGLPATLLLGLLLQPIHAFAAAAAPVLAAVHLVLVRVLLIRRGYLLLGPSRRRFNRWLVRLCFLWLGLPGWGLASVPVLGALAPPVTFGALSSLAHFYTLSGLGRERRRLPLQLWEKLALALLALATVAALVLAMVLASLLWLLLRELSARVHWP